MNQNQLVLNHLIDHGYITQLIASNYGVRRLASRIYDLTKEGIAVVAERRLDDKGFAYAHYTLSPIDRADERVSRAAGGSYKFKSYVAVEAPQQSPAPLELPLRAA